MNWAWRLKPMVPAKARLNRGLRPGLGSIHMRIAPLPPWKWKGISSSSAVAQSGSQ